MSPQDSIERIIQLCLRTDQLASSTYRLLGERASSSDESTWWAHMAQEEDEHCRYWERLGALAHEGGVPALFPDPDLVVAQLEEGVRGAELLASRAIESREVGARLLAGLRMEFYMLHPAFEDLFHFGQRALPGAGSGLDYDHHLDEFMEGVQRFAADSPELAVLGVMVSALWRRTRLVSEQAYEDPLTGVTNRRGMLKVLHTVAHLARRHGRAVSFAMVDIDDFKRVNDRFGHGRGDLVLREVAARLEAAVRSSDLLARWGGEEFLIVLPETPVERLAEVGEKIRLACASEPVEGIPLTVSVGLAGGLIDGEVEASLEALIKAADARMYEAKRAGKDRVVC
jgi:diguanylate cyclase (GGDEF)-like protein